MNNRLKNIIIFASYFIVIIGVVLYSRPADILFPPIWFFVLFCFLPCMVSYIMCIKIRPVKKTHQALIIVLAITSYIIIFRIQMFLVVYLPHLITEKMTYFEGLLSNFWVFKSDLFPLSFLAAMVICSVIVISNFNSKYQRYNIL